MREKEKEINLKTPEQETSTKCKVKKKKKRDITIKANKKGRHVMKLMSFLKVILVPIYWIFKPFKFYGNKKVKDGACVYVINHYTLFDPVYPACTTWEGIHFIAKKETFDAPILGGVLRKVKGIPANRDGNDVRVLLDCFKCLKNGDKIAIFPEGTRNRTQEEMLPFHHGAAAMAIKAKVSIIPVVIYKKPRFFRMTHVLMGEPMQLSEYYDRKLTEEEIQSADEKIRQYMLNLKREHKEFLENKKGKNCK